MANAENIQKVIEQLKNEQAFFDMNHWTIGGDDDFESPSCETPSCIGGWAESLIRKERGISNKEGYTLAVGEVGEWLGLNLEESDHLFFPDHYRKAYKATREQAIAHLEHLAAAGEVDWELFVPSDVI
ncbi:hypothetical protein EVB91_200 [Rhizobium phage RHph_I1_18]|nr:hypothetical protein EVB91_200 [Rhizobium phage RHph_I1_18]